MEIGKEPEINFATKPNRNKLDEKRNKSRGEGGKHFY